MKNVLSRFSKEESLMLQLLYNDLARRSEKENIDKEVFAKVFYLPGLLGERLFTFFDLNKKQFIDFECFLTGIASYCKETIENKNKVIFEICDNKDDLVLDAEEMNIVISLLGREILQNPELGLDVPVKPIRTRKRSKTVVKISANLHEEQVSHNQVESFLSNFGTKGTLSFAQFQEFLKTAPNFVKVFDRCFNQELWCNDLELTMTQIPMLSSYSLISGELYMKIGEKLIGKYAILRNKVLLLYENSNCKNPSEVIYMEGCYMDIIGDYYISNKFGISITHQNTNFEEIMLWSDSRKERDDWLCFLENASNYRKFKEFYTIGNKIGHGKFSDVYSCTENSTYKKWAVKVITKSKLTSLEKELIQSEINILKVLKHPGVIKIKDIFDSKKHILLVMELVEGGELFDRLVKKKVLSEYSASKIIKQLLEATSYLHNLGIVHRDIKPENILLTDSSDIPSIKLADFGLSNFTGPNDIQNLACGTLGYVAPEVLTQSGYNYKVDIWSIGVIAYLLLRGRLPFDHKEKQILIDLTLKANLSFEETYWKSFTPFAIDFMIKCIRKDPGERMCSKDALKHQWIKNADVLIPRAIDRKKMQEMNIERGVSSTNFGKVQYREVHVDVDLSIGISYDVRSMPELRGEDCVVEVMN